MAALQSLKKHVSVGQKIRQNLKNFDAGFIGAVIGQLTNHNLSLSGATFGCRLRWIQDIYKKKTSKGHNFQTYVRLKECLHVLKFMGLKHTIKRCIHTFFWNSINRIALASMLALIFRLSLSISPYVSSSLSLSAIRCDILYSRSFSIS